MALFRSLALAFLATLLVVLTVELADAKEQDVHINIRKWASDRINNAVNVYNAAKKTGIGKTIQKVASNKYAKVALKVAEYGTMFTGGGLIAKGGLIAGKIAVKEFLKKKARDAAKAYAERKAKSAAKKLAAKKAKEALKKKLAKEAAKKAAQKAASNAGKTSWMRKGADLLSKGFGSAASATSKASSVSRTGRNAAVIAAGAGASYATPPSRPARGPSQSQFTGGSSQSGPSGSSGRSSSDNTGSSNAASSSGGSRSADAGSSDDAPVRPHVNQGNDVCARFHGSLEERMDMCRNQLVGKVKIGEECPSVPNTRDCRLGKVGGGKLARCCIVPGARRPRVPRNDDVQDPSTTVTQATEGTSGESTADVTQA